MTRRTVRMPVRLTCGKPGAEFTQSDTDASDMGTAGLAANISRTVGMDNPDLLGEDGAIRQYFAIIAARTGSNNWPVTPNYP